MVDREIPFPLLSGQFFSAFDEAGNRVYYKVTRQPTLVDLYYKYEIAAGDTLTDETITLGTGSGAISAFRTPGLKEWVTWVDNDYLGVQWTIVNVKMNALNGFNEPMTKYTSPFGNVNFPMFAFQNTSGDVTFTLVNKSSDQTIAGTLHIELYDYTIQKVASEPPIYTDIEYRGGGKS